VTLAGSDPRPAVVTAREMLAELHNRDTEADPAAETLDALPQPTSTTVE